MMMPAAWVQSYLDIPFRDNGRDRTGVDCYGLVRLVYHDRLGIDLPSYAEQYETANDTKEILRLIQGSVGSSWHEVPMTDAQPYDGVMFRIAGQPTHCGVVVNPPWFLHTIKRLHGKPGKTWCERWDALLWRRRVLGAVRWSAV